MNGPDAFLPPALELRGISLSFGSVDVLRGVDLVVRRGEVHALVGHNGAGKSTLMRVAHGDYEPGAGEVRIGGHLAAKASPAQARRLGLGMVHQERSLIDSLDGLDNIFLNAEHKRFGLLQRRSERAEAEDLCEQLGIDPAVLGMKAAAMSPVQQQMVEIAKATRSARSVLILDEPTAPLTHREIDALFQVIRRLAASGSGVVMITHHLNEIFEVCDQVTVLRDGSVAATSATADATVEGLIEAMLGREEPTPPRAARNERDFSSRPAAFECRELNTRGVPEAGVSLTVREGEVVGLVGLAGSGRSTLLGTIFGHRRPRRGTMALRGRAFTPRGPRQAIAQGVFLVPEDRKVRGLHLTQTVEDNITLPVLPSLRRGVVFFDRAGGRRLAVRLAARTRLRSIGVDQPAQELSGGNQQKVVLAKALATEPTLLLLDEPTLGVDVGAARELIDQIRAMADTGAGVIWASSDLGEVLNVADRIIVLADGTVRSELTRHDSGWSEANLIHLMQRRQGSAQLQEIVS